MLFGMKAPKYVNLLIMALLLILSCEGEKKTHRAGKERVFDVKTVELKGLEFQKHIELKGFTEARLKSTVRSEVSGKVLKVYVEEGDSVKKGDILLKLDGSDYELKLKSLQEELKSIEARLERAKKAYERRINLYRRELIAREELERFKAEYESLLRQRESLSARVELALREYKKTTLSSPVKGYVLKRHVNTGDIITPQTPAFEIVKVSPLWFTFKVPAELLKYVQPGTEVHIHINGKTVNSRVVHILPQADRDRLFTVRAHLENRDESIKPMSYGLIRIPTERIRAFSVPEQAVQVSKQKTFLWKVEEGRVKSVGVQILGHEGNKVYVSGDLQEGDRVVVEGFIFLYEGARVVQR